LLEIELRELPRATQREHAGDTVLFQKIEVLSQLVAQQSAFGIGWQPKRRENPATRRFQRSWRGERGDRHRAHGLSGRE
jgi:hypothetical protein